MFDKNFMLTLGPFFGTWNQSQYVDFSTLVTSAAYTIVTPLNLENNNDIWAFVKPFDYWVWINFLISVPCFILILGIADYVAKGRIISQSMSLFQSIFHSQYLIPLKGFKGPIDWASLIGFTIRNVLSENEADPPSKKVYQKVLVYAWVWSYFVLVCSYAG